MFKTKNDLAEAIRNKAVELLNARLADAGPLTNIELLELDRVPEHLVVLGGVLLLDRS